MALKDFEHDMQRCSRCSYCKWVAWENQRHPDYIKGCPSSARYNFHAYAASGKWNMGYSLLHGRIDYSDEFQNAVYRCMMDGCCDVSCKSCNDIEPLENMHELRMKFVEDGQILPEHMLVIDGLKKEDNMMQGKKADRGKWADGIAVKNLSKETAKVAFRAGCRYSFDEELWPVVRGGLKLIMDAGVDVGIWGTDEVCCGGRADSMGFAGELKTYADHNLEALKAAGVEMLVTPCADCYQHYKVLYDKIGKKPEVEILHITEYLYRLIQEGAIKLTKQVPLTVTYHDPCHLGRLAEPWVHWKGKEVKVLGQMIIHDPPKKYRRGADGVYDIPREILKSIPGLKFVEMYRIKDSAWCCGAGGGVKEAYPDFADWTANERLKEAKAVGAKAIATSCGWCRRNFIDAMNNGAEQMEVYDLIELVQKAL
ncbi:MAG: (Fe-S)-binding protein [Syntrophorhabdales bacterium]|jgi:Fe-S oxidoreductase